jgi:hypothetical protein
LPALRNAGACKEAVHASAMEPDIPQKLLAATREYLAGFDDATLAGFLEEVDWSMDERTLFAKPLPCLHLLDRVSSTVAGDGGKIVRLLSKNRNGFNWGQTYTEADFGRHFIENYGWL